MTTWNRIVCGFWIMFLSVILATACAKRTQYVAVVGEKGDKGEQGSSGSNGQTGTQGASGTNGTNGTNGFNSLVSIVASTACTNGGTTVLVGLDTNRNNSLDVLEVSASADVCNGTNGTNGTNAPPTPFSPVGLINPCSDAPGLWDEVFIKLSNGTVLASFSDNISGYNTRFTVLVAGTYSTTDGDNCVFTIDNTGTITYENHHY